MDTKLIENLTNQITELRKELREIKTYCSPYFLFNIFNGDDDANFFYLPSLIEDYERLELYKHQKNGKLIKAVNSIDTFDEEKLKNTLLKAICARIAFKKVQQEVDRIRTIFLQVLAQKISIVEARAAASETSSFTYNKYKHFMLLLEDDVLLDEDELDEEIKKQYDKNIKELKERFNKK